MIEGINRYHASLLVSIALGWAELLYSYLVHGDPMWYATHMLPVYMITVGTFAYAAWGIWIREKPRQEIEAGL